ncbi:MAG: protein kinase, partial [Planctomycetes bacterium]|nr:protein kinase [Planctomycetota bacterium]
MKDFHVVHPGPEQLQAYGRGGLAPEERAELERHLADCESCRQALQTLARTPSRPQPNSSLEATAFIPATPPDTGSQGGTAAYFPGQGVPLVASVAGPPEDSAFPNELANHPRYRLLEYLGAGGMGTVYKAEHRLMGRLVALKVINPNLVDRPGAVERFRREVQAAARLSHPNIVTAFDAEQAGPTHFLVMEFVEGRSVGQLVADQGRLPVTRACDYARQVALGLQHAYERDMVHRDIKPHNLMVTPAGQIKILDFGLARLAMEDGLTGEPAVVHSAGNGLSPILPEQTGPITEAGAMMGTADYVAPEQAGDAHKADIRADIYSLGCTLYHFLAGRPPFPEGTAVEKALAHAQQVPRPLQELRKEVPPRLARIVARMLAKDPGQRYQTPAQVAQALAPFTGVRVGPPRWRQLVSGVTAALLLALLGVWGYWYGPEVYRY